MTFAACTAGFATNTEAAAEAAAWGGAAGRGMVLAMALKPRSDRTLRLKLRQRRIRRRLVKTKKQEKKQLGFSWFFAESPPSFETRDPKRRFESLDWVDGWIFTVLPFDVFLHFGPWKY